MKIVIIGAGAVGAYFGARLQQAGQKVEFLVRKQRAIQLSEEGMYITSPHGNYVFNDMEFTDDVHTISDPDLVLLAVKGYHLQSILGDIEILVNQGARVLPLLNGLEHIHILQDKFGKEAVIGGSAYIVSTLNERGHVVHSNIQHDFIYGPLHPSQEEICTQLEAITESAIMGAQKSEDILTALWNKYMFITAFSGVTTASNLPIGTIRKFPETFELVYKVLLEMQTLAGAHDVTLSDQQVSQALAAMKDLPEEATSSMHQDRRKSMTLEVEHLQGGAIRLARKAAIQLPVVESLYALIKPFEN
ncbi:ketopantoate reductase family protein [Bacillus massiliglaciei]|uniref:ketopantoate reductase family protein n=1 Tax=Bacillus massiliglaciei TaxID=1816693 RepID=UPI000A6CAF60|nr:2-dehydropantoate 2-reductase [Bacillus massiliglaciei]